MNCSSPQSNAGVAIVRVFCLALTFAACVGCGEGGPPRFSVSGVVSWNGQPVPRGYIVFTPDSTAGNSGPGTQVEIVDGRYQADGKQGTVGGPHNVSITGFDGQAFQDGPVTNPNGKLLFSDVKETVDLPKAAGEHNFSLTSPPRSR